MAENHYGVYVSLRTPGGLLWSSSRETWVEVQADVQDAFGEEYLDSFVKQVLGEPVATSSLGSVTESQAVAAVQEQLGAEQDGDSPTPQFEKCDICGGIKDQWKPPGISKAGKSYPGFFGCSNFANHRR